MFHNAQKIGRSNTSPSKLPPWQRPLLYVASFFSPVPKADVAALIAQTDHALADSAALRGQTEALHQQVDQFLLERQSNAPRNGL